MPLDFRGRRFGRLIAIEPTDRKTEWQSRIWRCLCDCGTEHFVSRASLQSGNTRSCGCFAREVNIQKCLARTIHGHGRRSGESRTHQSWRGMVERCTKPNHSAFARYGGRGIRVCARWLAFSEFLADMGERPEGTSIDRIDNGGDYSPDNCRWATQRTQGLNKSRSLRLLDIDDAPISLKEMAYHLAMPMGSLYKVLRAHL